MIRLPPGLAKVDSALKTAAEKELETSERLRLAREARQSASSGSKTALTALKLNFISSATTASRS